MASMSRRAALSSGLSWLTWAPTFTFFAIGGELRAPLKAVPTLPSCWVETQSVSTEACEAAQPPQEILAQACTDFGLDRVDRRAGPRGHRRLRRARAVRHLRRAPMGAPRGAGSPVRHRSHRPLRPELRRECLGRAGCGDEGALGRRRGAGFDRRLRA